MRRLDLLPLQLFALLFFTVLGVATLVDRHVRAIDSSTQPASVGVANGIWLLIIALMFLVLTVKDQFFDPPEEESQENPSALIEGLANALTTLAVVLAGRRRAHVREAWLSDLERPRDLADTDAPCVSAPRKVIYAAGLIRAAARYRIDDAAVLWWRVADGVLASRSWSRLVLVGPCAMAAATIVHTDGLYGLVINAENLIAIGTVSVGLVYGGRKARKVTLKPTRHKQDQT